LSFAIEAVLNPAIKAEATSSLVVVFNIIIFSLDLLLFILTTRNDNNMIF
jgi:hypothetical protein